jgi:hypothetical protein
MPNNTTQDNYSYVPEDTWDFTGTPEDYQRYMEHYYPTFQGLQQLGLNSTQWGNLSLPNYNATNVPWNATASGVTLGAAHNYYNAMKNDVEAGRAPIQFSGSLSDINRFLADILSKTTLVNPVENSVADLSRPADTEATFNAYGLSLKDVVNQYWETVRDKRGGDNWEPFSGKKSDWYLSLFKHPSTQKLEGIFNPWDAEFMKGYKPELRDLWQEEAERVRSGYYAEKGKKEAWYNELRKKWLNEESRSPLDDLNKLSEENRNIFQMRHNPARGNYYEIMGKYSPYPWEQPFKAGTTGELEPEGEIGITDPTGTYNTIMKLGRRDIENQYKRDFANLQQKMKYQLGMGPSSPLYIQAMRQLMDDRNDALMKLRMNAGKQAIDNALEVAKKNVDVYKLGQDIAQESTKTMADLAVKIREGTMQEAKHDWQEMKDKLGLIVDERKSQHIFDDWRAGRVKEAQTAILDLMGKNQEFMKVLNAQVLLMQTADYTLMGKLTEEEKKNWLERAEYVAKGFAALSAAVGNDALGLSNLATVFQNWVNGGGQT